MATREQIEAALRNAHGAGDKDAARRLAAALKAMPPTQQQAAPSAQEPSGGFSPISMIKNMPSSAANVAEGMYGAVTSPVQTAKGMDSLMRGAGVNLLQSLPEWAQSSRDQPWINENQEHEATADAVGGFYKSRYGGVDNLLNTLESDPVGAGLDLSAILGGVSGGSRIASTLPASGTKAASILGRAADVAQTTSATVNPINATINATKYGAGKMIPAGLPGKMYDSAAKFGTTLSQKDRNSLLKTALDNKIAPTSTGVDRLSGKIGVLDGQIDDLIRYATESGQTVPRSAVFQHLKALRNQKGGVRLGAQDDLNSINAVAKNLDTHLKSLGKDRLTAQDLQKLKVEAYKDISWDAKRMTGTPIKEDTYKAIARGAKDSIEGVVPEVGPINRQMGSLLELQPHIQRAANRIENRNLISLDMPLRSSAGGLLGGPGGAAAGAATSILGSPKIKSNLAIHLHQLQKSGDIATFLKNNPGISYAEVAAYLAGQGVTENVQ